MWEDNLGKVKTRKNKITKPYERPKSILRRVTDSVTGLLPQPSWLVNWLQPPSKVNETEDTEEPEPSTSSTSSDAVRENRNRESFIFRRPPGASGEQSNGRAALNVPTVHLLPEPVHAEVSLPTSRELSIQTNGDDDSNSESTSGCSSLLPHLENKRENRGVDLPGLTAVEPLSIDQSSLQMLGTTLSKTLAAELRNSRGRKTLSLHTFSQDNNLPVAEEGANGSSIFDKEDASLSRTACKRDLPQPQSYSFGSKRPRFNITSFGATAAEARKSLLSESVVDSPFYAGRTTYGGASAYRRATLQPSSTPYVRKRIQARPSSTAPPTPSGVANTSNVVLSSSAQRILQALEAMSTPVRDAKRIPAASSSRRHSMQDEEPSFSGFGLNRRRPNLGPPAAKLSIGTPAQVVARPKATAVEHPVSSTPVQAGGKMRTRVSASVRESAVRLREEEEEEEEQPELQPVPMGLTSLPSFNLLPAPATVVISPIKDAITSANGVRPAFTFSAPLVTVNPLPTTVTTTAKPPSFNFSSPLTVKTVVKTPEKEVALSELKTGSVLDILGVKSSSQEPAVVEPVKPIGFGDKFKPPSDSWTCSICCVSNPKDKTHCAACESPGPSAAVPAPPKPVAIPAPPKGFGDQFKMAASQWECTVCMVRNSDKDNKCKSCEELRPGAKAEATKAPPPSFKFGLPATKETTDGKSPANTGFTFGAAKKDDEPAKTSGFKFGATIEPKADIKEPETPKAPEETKEAGFKFGTAIESGKVAETAGFKFGATINSEAPAKVGFQFGAKLAEKPAEKPVEEIAPKVDQPAAKPVEIGFAFRAPIEPAKKIEEAPVEPAKPKPTIMFGGAESKPAAEKPMFSFGAPPSSVAEKLETGSVMDILGKKSTAPFAFGATVATTSAPSFSFGATESAAPKPSFSFAKSAATTETFIGFGVQEPSKTQAPAAAPSFSFSATPTAARTVEEPAKPSFSFGGPSTTPSLFKPAAAPSFAFGAPTSFTGTTTAATTTPSFSLPVTTTAAPPPVSAPSSSSIFAFGASAAAATTSATPTTSSFSFGSTAPTPTSFAFGAAAPPAYPFGSSETAKPSGFGFPTATTAAAVSTPAAAPSLFTFGAAAAAAPATTTTPSEPPKVGFSFGTPTAAPTASFGSFTPSKPAAAAAPSFAFGGATPAFGEPKSNVSFGAGAPFGAGFGAAQSSSFAFGTPSAAAAAPPPSSSSFGAAPNFNFGAAPAPAAPSGPVFQFGSAAAAAPGGFNFNTPTAAPSFTGPDQLPNPGFASGLFANPFDNQGSAGGPSRKIRKAVRRR